MNSALMLNEKWHKSAVIGTVWASSEIVLGSFLHNLRIPFSGSILTAIGLVILISISYVWKEKGIFWRAGVVCALMKTMSPSAFIFGPMIAIFIESILLEISVRMLGHNYLGFVTGSILAVSWSFLQKIVNLLIFYGFNIVELYKNIMKYTEKQLNLHFDTLWIPLAVLFAAYMLIGIVSAITGIKTGKSLVAHPVTYDPKKNSRQNQSRKQSSETGFSYSLFWLGFTAVIMIGNILLISLASWKWWIPGTVAVVLLWVLKYRRALRQLSNPKFWIFFVLITMLTALVFTQMQAKPLSEALLIGLEMNFRATVLIVGFSILGKELYNPVIRNYFYQSHFKQVPLALELSARSLPLVIETIPDFKTFLRNPVSVVSHLISYADYRLEEIKNDLKFRRKIVLIIGPVDSGKTTFLRKIIAELETENVDFSGFYSLKIFSDNERIGYDLVDAKSLERVEFLRCGENKTHEKIGKFSISPAGLRFGQNCLYQAVHKKSQVIVVDEVGKMELNGRGWAKNIGDLLQTNQSHLVLVVRDTFLEELIKKWNLTDPVIINVTVSEISKVTKSVVSELKLK